MSNTNRSRGESITDLVPQYGNFGGPDYCHGEWVRDYNALDGYRWTQTAEPIDGQDDLYLAHDMAYGLAEKKYENCEINFLEQSIMKTIADIGLLNGLRQYDPYADQRCTAKDIAQMYQILAMTAFTEKILWDNTYGHVVNPALQLLRNLFTQSSHVASPIILDLDRDGVETTGLTDGAYFDHDGNGLAEQTGWASSDDGLLVLDRNGNGTIDNGTELFGNETLLQNGQKAANGFQALAELDGNSDGKIDVSDAAFTQLRIWQDIDGDGYSAPDEFFTLSESGIISINTGYTDSTYVDANGNEHKQIGSFTRDDNSIGKTEDVWLQSDKMYTTANEWQDVPADVAALPDLQGYGNAYDLHQAMVSDISGQLQSLVEQFVAAEDVTTRESIMNQILFKWTGSDGITPGSNGYFIDARKVGVLEKIFGQAYIGTWGPTEAGPNSASLLSQAYDGLYETFYGQLMSQTHLKDLYDSITYHWDEETNTAKGDLTAVATLLRNQIDTDYNTGMANLTEFTRSLRGMDALGIMNFSDFCTAVAGGDTYIFNCAYYGGQALSGTSGNDTLTGTSGNDSLIGGAGDDVLYGGSGANTFDGGAGDDTLIGGVGADTYHFGIGSGHDVVFDSLGIDSIVFGEGLTADSLEFRFSSIQYYDGIVISIKETGESITIQNWFANAWYQIEHFKFANGTELTASQVENLANTAAFAGTDASEELWAPDYQHVNMYGNGGNDTLHGSNLDDTIDGGTGNDVMFGGYGNDIYKWGRGSGQDIISDSYGDLDKIILGSDILPADISITRNGEDVIVSINGTSDTLTLIGWGTSQGMVEQITFADGTIWDTATIKQKLLSSTDGNDTIIGFSSDDTLNGGMGADTLIGGAGNDTYIVDNAGDDVIENVDEGTDLIQSSVTYTLGANLENLTLTGTNAITGAGNSLVNIITGNDAGSTLAGGLGNDTYVVYNSDTIIVENAGEGNDIVQSYAADYTLSGNIEALTLMGNAVSNGAGNEMDNKLVGNSYANIIQGGAGNDSITGGAGNDSLDGGTGDDTLLGGTGNDTYIFNQGGGHDTIYNDDATSGNVDILRFGAGIAPADITFTRNGCDLILGITSTSDQITIQGWGVTQVNRIARFEFADGTVWDAAQIKSRIPIPVGTENSDTLYAWEGEVQGQGGNDLLYGSMGSDTLDGGTGADTLKGVAGNDTYIVDDAGDVVTEYWGEGIDTVQSYISYTLGSYLENLTLLGSAAITGTGNEFNNIITGNDVGSTLAGGSGNDMYVINSLADVIIEKGNEGTDTVQSSIGYTLAGNNVENLTLSGTENINGTGDTFNNVITGNSANNILDGGVGADTMIGGTGNDTYIMDNVDDVIIEDYNEGTDLVQSSFTYTLGANIENLTLTGSIAINGTGNELNNVLTGNTAANTLNGDTGNDTIYGGAGDDSIQGDYDIAGNDYLDGGDGNDTIIGAGGADTIYGGAGNDQLHGDASNVALMAQANDYIDGGSGDNLIAGYGGNDTLIAAEGNDTIYGGEGNDRITAGDGADVLQGDAGNDYIDGGAGNDSILGMDGVDELHGGDGNDSIWGGNGKDTIYGETGNDQINGETGDDYLYGQDGDDTIIGAGGSDTIYGGAGNDQLHGDASNVALADQGNDYIDGESGDNLIVGYGGDDTLIAAEGNDTIYGDAGNDSIDAGDGANTIYGGDGNNIIYAGAGSDYIVGGIEGGTGSNYINAGDGNNSLFGGGGNDEIYAGIGDDQINGMAGNDYINAGSGHNIVLGGDGNDTLYGGDGIDQLQGDAGDDYLDGGAGDDILLGVDGNDRIYGGDGNDSIWGGTGNDTIYGDAGNDQIAGEDGDDVLYGDAGNDLLDGGTGNNNMGGGDGDDTVLGGSGADTLYGGAGNDYLQGTVGNDTYLFGRGDGADIIDNYADDYDSTTDTIQFGEGITIADLELVKSGNDLRINIRGTSDSLAILNWFSDSADQVDQFRLADDTVLDSAQIASLINNTIYGTSTSNTLFGSSYNDIIYGYEGNDTIYGREGNDTLVGGAGNDNLQGNSGNDIYLFGRGSGQDWLIDYDITPGNVDTIVLDSDINPNEVTLSRSNTNLILAITGTSDTLVIGDWFNETGANQVEHIQFADGTICDAATIKQAVIHITEGNDEIYGYATADVLNGLGGDDTLYGYGGNDTLDGGTGNDSLLGGADNDTYIFGSGSGQDRIYDEDSISGNVDTIALGSDINPANITINRVNTNLVLSINGTSDTLTILDWFLDTGARQVEHIQFANGTIWDSVMIKQMILQPTEGADTIYGYETADVLSGLGGSDMLYGYGGSDTLDGGTGDDYLYGGTGNDNYLFGRGSGQDNIFDDDATAGNIDTVILGNDINPADVEVRRSGDDLVLTINGTDDVLRIRYWFNSSGEYQVERIQFADGTIWDTATIKQITSQPTEGDDYLEGTSNTDLIIGLGGNDTLYGYGGNDTLVGGSGNDLLYGGDDADTLDGGSGNDYLSGGHGNNTYLLGSNSGNDEVYASGRQLSDTDTIMLDAGIMPEDVILWAYYDSGNTLSGGLMLSIATIAELPPSTVDRVVSTISRDEILASTTASINVGDWFTYYQNLTTRIQFADGTVWEADQIYNWYLQGGDERDFIFGNAAANIITGNAGDDELHGNAGNDTLYGGDGMDWLWGDAGDNTFDGGPGADRLFGSYGKDIYMLNRGSGYDMVVEGYSDPSNIDTILLGNDVQPADIILQHRNNDLIVSISGTGDYMEVINYFADGGGYQIDYIKFADGTIWDAAYIQQHIQPAATEGDDTLTGTTGADYIEGLGGNDYLTGLAGDDTINGGTGADTMSGGAGDDYYSVDDTGDIATENTSEGTADTVESLITYTLGANVENLILSDTSAINGTGNTLDNYLIGNSAVNTLTGNAGNDTLDGGGGPDILIGGAGNDTYILYNTGITITENPGEGTDTVESSRTFTLGSNIENLTLTGENNINGTGNTLANVLTGNDANNTLTGGTGADTMIGVAGDDIYVVDDALDVVTENVDEGIDIVKSSVSFTLSSYVENLTLTGTSAINGNGNELDNTITGNSGVNILDGGMGADTLIGGAGNDTYIVDNAGDIVTEGASAGTDTIQSSVSYTLSANTENLTLTGTTAINATGNEMANVITGNSVANILDGGTGKDTITGGTGNDTYLFGRGYGQDTITDNDATAGNMDTILLGSDIDTTQVTVFRSGDNLVISINGTTDTLTVQNWFVANYLVEQIQFAGGTIWDQAYIQANLKTIGTSGNDNLTGTSGADLLSGLAGNDTLTGLAGDDTLDGGAGADSMLGSADNDTYIRDNTGDVITENVNEGTDTVQTNLAYTLVANVENLTLTGTSAISGTGNTLANYLTGNSAINTLTGNAGNDTLDGGAGADSLVGGAGNDSYIVDNTGDKITESSGAGTDTVLSSVTYTLAANVENLTLTGTSAINATGNTLANVLTGNSANNTLSGGTGADTMIGGNGDDTYVRDNTGDVITENLNEGIDTVQTNMAYTLGANVENLTLTGSTAISGTGNTLANVLTGNTAANTLTGGAGNDTLNGGTGADTMLGGADNDTYIRDNTGDVITENANEGIDTVQTNLVYTLGANVENLTLTGTSAISGTGNTLANYLTGNTAANTLTGGAGNDTLDGGTGADTMIGGADNDTYIRDNTGDVITENASAGIDTVQTNLAYTLAANLENLTLTGTSAINGTGNTLDNYLTGNSAINTLTGAAGNDTLDGGLGNDSLVGGANNDTYIFRVGSGQDSVDNNDTTTGRIDTIRFEDVASTGLRSVTQSGNDLILDYGVSDTVTIKNYYLGTAYQVDQFIFSDNVTYTASELLAAYPSGMRLAAASTPDDRNYAGGSSAFDEGAGGTIVRTICGPGGFGHSDVLSNFTSDRIIVASNAGNARQQTNPAFTSVDPGGIGSLVSDIEGIISKDQLTGLFSRFNDTDDGTDRLSVSDGHFITRQDIETIVNTMSEISNNTGMDVMQKYNAMMADQTYISTLAQTWQQM